MKKYRIASLRGSDFVVYANNPEEAWIKLCEQENDNGSLWKTGCEYRNKTAVEREGFTLFVHNEYSSGAYKEVQ